MTEPTHPNPTADFDYSEFKPDTPAVGGNLMSQIEGLAQDHVAAEALVASLEAQLGEAKANLRDIAEHRLPDLLDSAELGDSTLNTPAGFTVKMGTAIRGSIPKDNEREAFKWLEDHNNGAMIKRVITIDFGKNEDKWADKFERDCAQRKVPLNLKRKKAVHPQTLQAWVRQSLEEGIDIPLNKFGVYRQRFAKVTVKTNT